MKYLVFQLRGHLSSWGTVAIGDIRPTQDHPTRSAVVGIVCSALGIRRVEEDAILDLATRLRIGVVVMRQGTFLRDYHTVQVAAGTKVRDRPARAYELVADKADNLKAMLTFRDYFSDAHYLVVLSDEEPSRLDEVNDALQSPHFAPFLGRKSCPLDAPVFPRLFETDNARSAVLSYVSELEALGEPKPDSASVFFESGIDFGAPLEQHLVRDRIVSRARWQFGNRNEFRGTVQFGGDDALSH